MTLKFAAALVTAILFAAAAHAEDYAQDGIYVLQGQTPPATPDDQAKLQLKCALNFYVSGKSGTFAQYFLDKEQFLKDGKVSYLEANAGACQLDDKTRLESCQSKYAASGKIDDESPTFNFYKEMSPERITAYYFDSADAFSKWKAAGSDATQDTWTQLKCNDVTSALVTPRLSQQINTLSLDDTAKRIFQNDDPTADDYELAKKVTAALKK